MKPILHLLGDRYKAQQFVRFAERKLNELKIQMSLLGIKMQNRMYRFTTDSVEVYIESYLGIDKIRIKAAAAVAEKKINIPGDGAFTLPQFILGTPGAGISYISAALTAVPGATYNNPWPVLVPSTMTVDVTSYIWNATGDIVIQGETRRYVISVDLTHSSSGTALVPIHAYKLSKFEPFYYGVIIDYISRTGDAFSVIWSVSGTADSEWEQAWWWNGSAWELRAQEDDNRQLGVQWRNPFTFFGASVGSYAFTGAATNFTADGGDILIVDESTTGTRVARKVMYQTPVGSPVSNPPEWRTNGNVIGDYMTTPQPSP